MEILYFKAPRTVNIVSKRAITVSDLGELTGKPEIVHQAKKLEVTHLSGGEKERRLISIMDVIETVQRNLKDTCVINTGAQDIILSYKPMEEARKSRTLDRIKTALICAVLFFGGMFAIMTFHTDAGVPDVFVEVNRIFTGQEESQTLLADWGLRDWDHNRNHALFQSFFQEEAVGGSDTGGSRVCRLREKGAGLPTGDSVR